MALDSVLLKIREAGEAECRAMLADAEAEAAKIKGDAEVEAESAEKADAQAVAAEIERLTTQELSSAEIEARKIVLNAQKEILDRLRDSVLDALVNLPAERPEALMKKLLKIAERDLPDGILRCAERDCDMVARNSRYERGEPIETAGGFVVTAKDGSLTLDMRFETLVDDFWNRRLKEITERLFSET